MAKYILSYDKIDKDDISNDIFEKIVKILFYANAINIKSPVESTFTFTCKEITSLSLNSNIEKELEQFCFYVLVQCYGEPIFFIDDDKYDNTFEKRKERINQIINKLKLS